VNTAAPQLMTPAQLIDIFADTDKITCEAKGKALVAGMNTPVSRGTNQKFVYTCVNF
jgi:hypothetical protein